MEQSTTKIFVQVYIASISMLSQKNECGTAMLVTILYSATQNTPQDVSVAIVTGYGTIRNGKTQGSNVIGRDTIGHVNVFGIARRLVGVPCCSCRHAPNALTPTGRSPAMHELPEKIERICLMQILTVTGMARGQSSGQRRHADAYKTCL